MSTFQTPDTKLKKGKKTYQMLTLKENQNKQRLELWSMHLIGQRFFFIQKRK
jgi:hypothetical protein